MIGNPTNPTSVLHPARRSPRSPGRAGRSWSTRRSWTACPARPRASPGRRAVPGLVVVRSLTKTWGLAGLRVGYVLAEPALVARLAAAQPLWSVSTPALAAAEACMSPACPRRGRRVGSRPRRSDATRLAAALAGLGLRRRAGRAGVVPACASPARRAGWPYARRFATRGYAVRRGDTFPGLGPDWLRVAVRDAADHVGLVSALAGILRRHPTAVPACDCRFTTLKQAPSARRSMDLIAETIAAIRPLDETAMRAARDRQDRLTKPRGRWACWKSCRSAWPARGRVPAAPARARRRRRVRRRPRGARPGRHAVAAGGDRADGGQLPGRRRRGQRVRPRRPAPRSASSTSASWPTCRPPPG